MRSLIMLKGIFTLVSSFLLSFRFYVHPPTDLSSKPIIFVPVRQVSNFLTLINHSLGTQLYIPHDANMTGFMTSFTEEGIDRPRYLGRSTHRYMSDSLRLAIPPAAYKPDAASSLISPTDRSVEAFRKKIELLLEDEKKKKAATKEKKNAERKVKQMETTRAVKRVQSFLGMRKSVTEIQNAVRKSLHDTGTDWVDSATLDTLTAKMVSELPTFSTGQAPPFPQDCGVIFISVDVEAYERNQRLITEVGIATLDTLDINQTASGKVGENWRNAIRARHFRIKEYGHLNNKDFVKGCADKFEFG